MWFLNSQYGQVETNRITAFAGISIFALSARSKHALSAIVLQLMFPLNGGNVLTT
jgi:hypothetical protein